MKKGCSGWHFARDPLRVAKETRHRSPTARNSLHSRMTNLASKHPLKVLMIREAWNCPYTSTTDFECLVELLRRLKPSPQRSLQLNPHPVTADLLRELSTTTVGLETLSTPSRLVALFDNPARVFGLSNCLWSELLRSSRCAVCQWLKWLLILLSLVVGGTGALVAQMTRCRW